MYAERMVCLFSFAFRRGEYGVSPPVRPGNGKCPGSVMRDRGGLERAGLPPCGRQIHVRRGHSRSRYCDPVYRQDESALSLLTIHGDQNMNRRDFLKAAACAAAGAFFVRGMPHEPVAHGQEAARDASPAPGATVYMTRNISPAGLMAIYRALGRTMAGKVAVKLTVGEPGGRNFLSPNLIGELVTSVKGTFVDSNTAYGGRRATARDHLQAAGDHGFLALAPMDILDEEGEISLPIQGGSHLRDVRVGSHFSAYDSMMVLTHFKGHAMAGFGGALKNIAIGIASRTGKCLVHTAGKSSTNAFAPVRQEHFLEAMAEAAEGMIRAMGAQNMAYINVMNRLSVDCDCDSHPAEPELPDIGILASLDPVALDRACVDLVYAADHQKSASLRQRMESLNGTHVLTHAERLGIGNQRYTLVGID